VASIASFKTAAKLPAAYPSHALLAAKRWAEISHLTGDLMSALDGYCTALELLPRVVWLGLETSLRQDWLLREKSENMGCRAASCAIQLGQLEEAVELLDLGRSVFWQQASSLRSDLEKLREKDPELATKLERVGQRLDAGNFSSSGIIIREQGVGYDQHSAEDVIKERLWLVREWEELVARVRMLQDFQYFLKPTPFYQLCQASKPGHVVIINTSKYRVDALIFDGTGPIEHMPLPDIDLETLTELADDVHMFNQLGNTSATK
jgi:hypothetical protein